MPTIDHITEDQKIRKYVVDRILECRAITVNDSMFSDVDVAYIKLLDYCLVDREKIRAVYYNVSPYKVSRAFRNSKISLIQFQPQLIGITEEEFTIFLENVF